MLLMILLFSCQQRKEVPAGVLSHDEMARVFSELYITEEKILRMNLPADSNTAVAKILEEKVFEKTGVPDSIFAMSFEYYMANPRELELIYTALVDSLQLKEQRTPSPKTP
jgi:hypothetical protein